MQAKEKFNLVLFAEETLCTWSFKTKSILRENGVFKVIKKLILVQNRKMQKKHK